MNIQSRKHTHTAHTCYSGLTATPCHISFIVDLKANVTC